MNIEKFDEVRSKVADELREKLGTLKEHAEHFAHQQLDEMVEKEDAYALTEDEERMLKAYRRFLARANPNQKVFKWKIPKEQGIVVPPEPSLIQDPSDLSYIQ